MKSVNSLLRNKNPFSNIKQNLQILQKKSSYINLLEKKNFTPLQ